MPAKRDAKKSESIEIRLSYEAKTAFMRQCADNGITASECIRDLIDGRSAAQPVPTVRAARWRTVAAIAAGMALGAGATAPALAHASHNDRAAFKRLDRNHDGVLSYGEFCVR